MYQYIESVREGDFEVVTMVRPEKRNALSEAHLRELLDAFERIARSDARGAILAARGPVFSAGHDFSDMAPRDEKEMRSLLDVCSELMQKLGKHSTGKACLYIKRLSDVDQATLRELVRRTVERATQE